MRSKSIKDYEIIIASNVGERDGIGIEIWAQDQLLIEIFQDDKSGNYAISLFEKDLPLNLIEESIERFKKEISSVSQ